MYISDISQPNFSQNSCMQCWDMNFFHLYILQKLKTWFFQKSTFFKIGTLFNKFWWTLQDFSKCIFRRLTAKLVWTVPRYEFFSSLYPPKTLDAIFLKVHFSKFTLYMLIFWVLSSNMPPILLENVVIDTHCQGISYWLHYQS